ncbi:MAG: hypothetical protein ACRDPT_03825 [Streptomycetales bacterium]
MLSIHIVRRVVLWLGVATAAAVDIGLSMTFERGLSTSLVGEPGIVSALLLGAAVLAAVPFVAAALLPRSVPGIFVATLIVLGLAFITYPAAPISEPSVGYLDYWASGISVALVLVVLGIERLALWIRAGLTSGTSRKARILAIVVSLCYVLLVLAVAWIQYMSEMKKIDRGAYSDTASPTLFTWLLTLPSSFVVGVFLPHNPPIFDADVFRQNMLIRTIAYPWLGLAQALFFLFYWWRRTSPELPTTDSPKTPHTAADEQ